MVVRRRGLSALMWACAVVCFSQPCRAQQSPPRQGSSAAATASPAERGETLLREAHALTKTAKSREQFERIIDMCQQAQVHPLAAPLENYGRQLTAWAYNRRGEWHAAQNQPEEALADFEEAVALDDTRWQAVHNRAVSYAQEGRIEEALADFDRTIDLNSNYANAFFNRGELRYDLEDFQGAIEDYDAALRLRPTDVPAFNSRGHSYYKLGDYRAALRDYNEAIRLDPQFAAAYINRGDAHADLGEFAPAARDYRAAIRIDPHIGRAYQSAAWLMVTCPDANFRSPSLGLEAAQKAIELDGQSDPRYLDTMAAALASDGQFAEAIQWQQRAIQAATPEMRSRFSARLGLYERKQPYRDRLSAEILAARRGGGAAEPAHAAASQPPRPATSGVQRASGQTPRGRRR